MRGTGTRGRGRPGSLFAKNYSDRLCERGMNSDLMGLRDRRAAPARVRCSPRRGCRDRPGGRVTAREECGRDAERGAREGAAYAPDSPGAAVPGEPLRAGSVRALRILARRRHEAGRGRCGGRGRWRAANRMAGQSSVSIVNARKRTAHINNPVVTLDLASSQRDADDGERRRLPVRAAADWNHQVSHQ